MDDREREVPRFAQRVEEARIEGGPRGSGEEGQEDEADAADTDAAGVGGEIVDLIAKASRASSRALKFGSARVVADASSHTWNSRQRDAHRDQIGIQKARADLPSRRKADGLPAKIPGDSKRLRRDAQPRAAIMRGPTSLEQRRAV